MKTREVRLHTYSHTLEVDRKKLRSKLLEFKKQTKKYRDS